MKILCVIDSLGSGGAQRQLVELAKGFREKGNEVSFLVYHEQNFYKEILEKDDIQITYIKEINYIIRLFKMRRFIRSGNYDTVLSFLEAANFICEIAGLPWRNWRLVVGERSANPNIMKSWKLRIYRLFHFFADYVVSNSNKNIQMVEKINPFLSEIKCKVIYNIVDLEKWVPCHDYKSKEKGKFRLVIAASHQYLKNLNGLIEAINLLAEDEKKQLVINWYGDRIVPPYVDNSFPEGLNKIMEYRLDHLFNFFPATHDIKNKIQESCAVGLFSTYEGLPNSLCEAMACAKPVICSSVSDNSLLISNSNLLCDAADATSIARSLRYLLSLSNNELEKIGATNREKAKKLFAKDVIIENYLNILKQ